MQNSLHAHARADESIYKTVLAFSLAMQPTYSELVTFVANYCRNTQNICVTNVQRINMCSAVFEISWNFSKSQELTISIMVYYGIRHHTLETWASIRKNFPTVLVLAALLTSIWLPHHSHSNMHSIAKYINVRRSVNCEILCNISMSQGHGNFSKSQELTIYTIDVKMWLSESFPLITSFYRF